MEDLESFNQSLANQGNLETQSVSLNPARMQIGVELDSSKDELKQEEKTTKELDQDTANGKIMLMKSTFTKVAIPLWEQYDEEKTL